MRKFRYIEPGYGCDSLSQHEKDELLLDFDIPTTGYYTIVPVTKYEFGLLVSSSNSDWSKEDEKLPASEPDKPGSAEETINISSVVAERFMQMDQDIQEFIRREVEEEVKAELDRRGFEDSEY